ncbi:MAG: peptidoglycan DD-metalloendopeptidase family protein [Lachnospiraceae bacterium]|nr:peptidoglycan DD-metalloendopeptidase family protein [Lachnospiraceae bacterium]
MNLYKAEYNNEKKNGRSSLAVVFVFIFSLMITVITSVSIAMADGENEEDFDPDEYDLNFSYQSLIDEAKREQAELENTYSDINSLLAALYQESSDLDAKIRDIDMKTTEVLATIRKTEQEIADKEAEISATNEKIELTKKEAEDQYETMKKRIKYIYENSGETMFDVLAGGASLTDVLNQLEYRNRIAKYDETLYQRYLSLVSKLEQYASISNLQLESLERKRKQNEGLKAVLNTAYNERKTQLAQLANDIGVDEELLAEYWEDIVVKKADINKLQQIENARLEEIERLAQAQVELENSINVDDLLWPFPASNRITSPFGYRGDIGVEGASEYHFGIDISGARVSGDDELIVAALAGQVITAKYSTTAGWFIRIRHTKNFTTTYMHASELFVEEGEYVTRGQVIMRVGSTGISSGPHLHFEMSLDGTRVDPLKYVTFEDQKYFVEIGDWMPKFTEIEDEQEETEDKSDSLYDDNEDENNEKLSDDNAFEVKQEDKKDTFEN